MAKEFPAFLVLILTLGFVSLGHSQIPNPGFEYWEVDDYGYETPVGWEVNYSSVLPSIDTIRPSVLKTEKSYVQNFAALLKPLKHKWRNGPGILMTGGYIESNKVPESFHLWLKFLPGELDTVYIEVSLFKKDSIVAQTNWQSADEISEYKEIQLNFLETESTDSFHIRITAGCCRTRGEPNLDTELYVDQLFFKFKGDSVLPPVEPELPKFSAPNIFTPNGDGINDTWQIPALEHFPENRVRIYNRWGQLVFETDNYSGANAWDGGGLPVGTYYYLITVEGYSRKLTGFVSLVR